MNMRNYRNAFAFALVGNLALVAILATVVARKQHREARRDATAFDRIGQSSPNGSESAAMARTKLPRAIQLSPERLQSIGVRTGRVESRR